MIAHAVSQAAFLLAICFQVCMAAYHAFMAESVPLEAVSFGMALVGVAAIACTGGADPEVPLLAPVAEHLAPQELGLQQALALQLMPRARKIAGPAGCPAEKGSLSLLVPAAADQARQVARGGVQEQLRKHCSLSIGCNAEAQG